MALSNTLKEKISLQVIKVLATRFENFPEDASNNRNAPFHKAFLNAFSDKFNGKVSDIPFFISLSSWLQGLNTSMGQTFFESVANILSEGEKREYTSKKLGTKKITTEQKNNCNVIITNLSNAITSPNLVSENAILFIADSADLENALDFSADVFIEDDTEIIAIELKSVKPNSGEMRGEKQKIIEGKAALHRLFPGKNIRFLMGFPFDPTNADSETGSNKTRFMGSIINMNKYFSQDEVLLASELWDFLSGEQNTMEQLLDIINTIATPDFMQFYDFIIDPSNKNKDMGQYLAYLAKWNLFSEIHLVTNDVEILKATKGEYKLARKYHQLIFDKDADYNIKRFEVLNGLIPA